MRGVLPDYGSKSMQRSRENSVNKKLMADNRARLQNADYVQKLAPPPLKIDEVPWDWDQR